MTSFTDFFIKRPVFAWVINIMMILLGLAAWDNLSLRQYPKVDYPVVTVRTEYRGADAKIVESQVTNVLEDALMRIPGKDYLTSESRNGESDIKVFFKSGYDMNHAVSAVTEVTSASPLPDGVDRPVIIRADVDASPLAEVVLTGDQDNGGQLRDYGNRVLKSSLQSIEGVGSVRFEEGAAYEMKVTLDPLKLSFYKVAAQDIVRVLLQQNIHGSAGRLKAYDREFQLTVEAALKHSPDFEKIPLMKRNGSIIRLGDVGKVRVTPRDPGENILYNGRIAKSFGLVPESQANPVEMAKAIKAKVQELRKNLPKGMALDIAMDKSIHIENSIYEVIRTIGEASLLVVIVVFLFLWSLQAALVPLVTIPISLISTFFIMSFFGFTINILTLLAMVLAIGLVVDDAIVVLENIYRYLEEGLSPLQSSLRGAREIAPAIVAMTITLAVVYLPIGLSQGKVGKLFSEFAMTLAGSVLISGIVSLTLSPTMCARLLKVQGSEEASAPEERGWFAKLSQAFQWLGTKVRNFLDRLDLAYGVALKNVIKGKKWVALSLGIGLFASAVAIERLGGLPKMLSPEEDQGRILVFSTPPLNVTLDYVTRNARLMDKNFSNLDHLKERLIYIRTAPDTTSYLQLAEGRRPSCQDILEKEVKGRVKDLVAFDSNAICISDSVLSSGGGNQLSFVLKGSGNANQLRRDAIQVLRTMASMKDTFYRESVNYDLDAEVPKYNITVKRDMVFLMGIDPEQINETLSTLIQGRRSSKFEKEGEFYDVVVSVGEEHKTTPKTVLELHMRGRHNEQEFFVPLKDLIDVEETYGSASINHFNKQRSVKLWGELRPGKGMEQAYNALEKYVNETYQGKYRVEPAGTYRSYLAESKSLVLIFALALFFIFLVMAAQFESVVDPFIILLTVPLAVAGGVWTLFLVPGGSLNIFSSIGFLTLIGLITKHGILMVDFANEKQRQGKNKDAAIVEACQLRLRPILMTTLAMVLGSLPLAISSGSGSEIRQQIGWTIVGGMSIGTLFTLFVIPVVYVLLSRVKSPEAPPSA